MGMMFIYKIYCGQKKYGHNNYVTHTSQLSDVVVMAGVHVSKLKVKLCGSSYDVEVIPDTFTVKRYIQHKISAASNQVRLLKLTLY